MMSLEKNLVKRKVELQDGKDNCSLDREELLHIAGCQRQRIFNKRFSLYLNNIAISNLNYITLNNSVVRASL